MTVAALAVIVAGWMLSDGLGLLLTGLGIGVFVLAVLIPAIREVEFGLPPGTKVSAALQDRREELQMAFESQQEDLERCAHLLCTDPAKASDMVERAWERAAAAWRGPVTPEILTYTLCLLVRFIGSPDRLEDYKEAITDDPARAPVLSTLAALDPTARTVVVLHEVANLSVGQIARITDSPSAQVVAALDRFQLSAGGPSPDSITP
ncbi:hypothetical protein LVY72_20825 [Arthrobacter sp. I2-34]|uniref:Uncharacterized protein n=1 Tax=Arthrobacter hankyongi TaxID=2904801 RepID=A0ABS9LCD7_9MICC|nr:hypothetical protein [Arthrobacter hankyongi]MCG2624339.1 hypothetical protein [Arthrobacter hankyongi]